MAQEWTPPPPSDTPDKVPNYLIPAIISALCCFPLGIISIIFAAQVNGKVASGDTAGALDAAKKAKLFSIIFIALGVVLWGCYFLFGASIVGLSILSNS
jgi:Interferon-induced transmembrane protein